MARSPYARYGRLRLPGTIEQIRRHEIRGGETLPSITHRYFADGYDQEMWRQIAEANEVEDLDALGPGDVIKIPARAPS